jgi:nucleoid DNA-binding protein
MSSAVKATKLKSISPKTADASNVQASKSPKAQAAASTSGDAAVNPEAPRPVIIGPVMRKKELIDTVVERSGIKKKDAKPVVEAMLEILGEALGDNRELNLLPMGKFKVVNEKDLGNGKMMRVKVRQVTPSDKPKVANAATDESDI